MYLDYHLCKTLYQMNITVELYEKNNNRKWYLNKNGKIVNISRCPYCGKFLETNDAFLW